MARKTQAKPAAIEGEVIPRGPYQRAKGTNPPVRTVTMAQLAIEAAQSGITPVELMLNAMREFNDEAEEAFKCASEVTDEKRRKELRSYGRTMISMAVDVAKDVAPYIHPRLTSIAVGGDEGGIPIKLDKTSVKKLSVKDLDDLEALLTKLQPAG